MKKLAMLLLMQFLGLWLLANPNESIGSLQIYGKVADENGKPLIGATVVIENTLQGTTTNLNGEYNLKRLRPGKCNVIVSFIGYEKKTVEVDLDGDKEVNITLIPSSIMGEEIIVNATRASTRMPIAQTSLSKDEIKSTSSGFDIPYLLEMIPSVVATSEGGTGVGNTAFRIRGSDMSRINVTVNGIPLNDPESQAVYWVDLPDFTSSVDNVQVQRGVGTSTNGAGAFGASINFQTSTVTPEPFADIEFMTGSFGTWRTTAKVGTGLISKKFSFEGRFSQLYSDGYIDRGTSDDRSMFLTGAWHTSKSLLRFNIIHGEEHTGITWEGNPGYMLDSIRTYNPAGEYINDQGKTCYYKDEKDNYIQTHYQLMYNRQLSNGLNLSAALFWTKGAGYYEEYKTDKKFSKYGLDALIFGTDTIKKTDFITQKWMDNDFYGTTISLNFRHGTIDATAGGGWNYFDGDHYGKIIWTKVNSGIFKNYEWYVNTGKKTDYNIFGKATWQFANRFSLYGDLQYRSISYDMSGFDDDLASLNQSHQWNFFNPKFGSIFKISSQQEVFASFGVGHREPSRADIKDAMKGTTNYTPSAERLFDYELGYALKTSTFGLNLNLYYMDYKDQLVLTGKLSDVGYALMTNVDKSYRAGVEVTFSVKPLSWLTWNLNTTLSRNRIKNFVEYIDLYDDDWNIVGQQENHLGETPISFSPSFIGSSQVCFTPAKNLNLTLISKYVGEQYYDNTGSAERRLDDYLVNNLKIDYSLKLKSIKTLNFQFFINNLSDLKYEANAWVYRAKFVSDGSEYREDGFFPQAGINFMAKMRVEF